MSNICRFGAGYKTESSNLNHLFGAKTWFDLIPVSLQTSRNVTSLQQSSCERAGKSARRQTPKSKELNPDLPRKYLATNRHEGTSLFCSKSNLLRSYCAQLRNRFQERCNKEARRSRRRIGLSYCRRARPILTNRGKRCPCSVRHIGRRSMRLSGVAAIRSAMLKILLNPSLPICWSTRR